jgi:hypothetical protein
VVVRGGGSVPRRGAENRAGTGDTPSMMMPTTTTLMMMMIREAWQPKKTAERTQTTNTKEGNGGRSHKIFNAKVVGLELVI